MKAIFLFLFTVAPYMLGLGQPLTGIKSIPGDYATIQLAIADLNARGAGPGGVIFNVAALHTETLANNTSGLITATGSSVDTIVFRKDPSTAGNNPKITAYIGTTTDRDGMIILAGGDYITIDGIDLEENPANNTATKYMEWGYAMVKKQNIAPFDGCQHVTIKNCTITLAKANRQSTGIYSGNHIATNTTLLTLTAVTDAMNDAKISNNTISNVYQGIALKGYNHPYPGPYTLYDHNNRIGADGANTITNYGGPAGAASYYPYGIFTTCQEYLQVGNNVIASGTGSTNFVYGIYLSGSYNANAEVFNNDISVRSASTFQTLAGIYVGYGGVVSGNTISIHDNHIHDCSFTAETPGSFYAISQVSHTTTANIYNNYIYNNIIAGTGNFYGIEGMGEQVTYLNNYESPTQESYYNNSIHDLSVGGTATANNSGIFGIYTKSAGNSVKIISLNTIHSFKLSTKGGGTVTAIKTFGGSTVSICRNNIFNLETDSSNAMSYGIHVQSGTTVNMQNNLISDLKTPQSYYGSAIKGIYVEGGGTLKLYYNTILLNASSTTKQQFGSAGIVASASPTVDLRNNLVVNISSPVHITGNSYTSAYVRTAPTFATYSDYSNNNCFYAGIPGAHNVIFWDGTNTDSTMEAYQTRVSPRDQYSFTENPPFVNGTTPPFNLRITPSVPTKCESAGTIIADPGCNVDFEGGFRFPEIGYPESSSCPATAPDIGAYEFAGIQFNLLTWTGAWSSDWNNPGNWNPGLIPGSENSVVIPSGTANDPEINNDGESCKDLIVKKYAKVTIDAGKQLNVYGNTLIGD
ncbi:MAG: hypothetical protein WCK09_05255 [Bacteroidota bacterium]